MQREVEEADTDIRSRVAWEMPIGSTFGVVAVLQLSRDKWYNTVTDENGNSGCHAVPSQQKSAKSL